MSYTLTKEDVMVLAKKEHTKYEDACKEIETHIKLNKRLLEDIDKAGKEIERLNNIIKEADKRIYEYNNIVREVREKLIDLFGIDDKDIINILEILDKGE